jgi:hypothetical protein
MLVTLLGRWQTRVMLFLWIGIPVSIIFGLYLAYAVGARRVMPLPGVSIDLLPLQIMCTITLVGLILDPLYIWLQHFRWERDWPFAFQFFFSIIEFLIVLALVSTNVLPFMARAALTNADYYYIVLQFSIVFGLSFIGLLGFVQIFMIRWRFKGGEWGRL